jgi:hypothetical protein
MEDYTRQMNIAKGEKRLFTGQQIRTYFKDDENFLDFIAKVDSQPVLLSNVIPFGKYKNMTFEQVQQENPAYLQWLFNQPWLKTDWNDLYTSLSSFTP